MERLLQELVEGQKKLLEGQKRMETRLDRMAMDVNFLVRKAAEHEADIFEFKKVK